MDDVIEVTGAEVDVDATKDTDEEVVCATMFVEFEGSQGDSGKNSATSGMMSDGRRMSKICSYDV